MSSWRDEDEELLSCQREIKRLHGVCREYKKEEVRLKKMIQCLVKGMECKGTRHLVSEYLVLGGADTELHALLTEVMEEELS